MDHDDFDFLDDVLEDAFDGMPWQGVVAVLIIVFAVCVIYYFCK
jgi:hypothetical protein